MRADERDPQVAEPTAEVTEALLARLRELMPARAQGAAPLTKAAIDRLAQRMVAALPSVYHPYANLGPFYDTPGLTAWLNVSRQALHDRVSARRLLACPTGSGRKVYPAWQFTASGALVPGLADVLGALLGSTDPWTATIWLTTPAEAFGERTAIDVLLEDRDTELVLATATAEAARWAA